MSSLRRFVAGLYTGLSKWTKLGQPEMESCAKAWLTHLEQKRLEVSWNTGPGPTPVHWLSCIQLIGLQQHNSTRRWGIVLRCVKLKLFASLRQLFDGVLVAAAVEVTSKNHHILWLHHAVARMLTKATKQCNKSCEDSCIKAKKRCNLAQGPRVFSLLVLVHSINLS